MAKSLILAYFSKDLTKSEFRFCAFRRKTLCEGNVEKIFKEFFKKLRNFIILAYFSKEFNKPFVTFLRDWTKNTICRKF